MNTKESIISLLSRDINASVAVRTTDSQGNNESYNICPVEVLLDEEDGLPSDKYKCDWCVPVSPEDIDINIWAQEFPADCVEALRKDLADGILQVATFTSENGTMQILF